MIDDAHSGVRLFPDVNRPDYVPSGRLSGFGWPNMLAYWKTGRLSFEQPYLPFSIVVPIEGSIRLSVDRRHVEVSAETYLATPPGAELHIKQLVATSTTRRPELLIAFCNQTFIRNVWQSNEERFHPIPRIYREDEVSRSLVRAVAAYLTAPVEAITDEMVEDLLYQIIRIFAARDQDDRARWAELSARDEAERVRLFGQLSRARDLANAEFHRPLTVDLLASEAGLSKYHFIRLFERAFGATPYRYLHQVRLEHARRRVEEGFRDIGLLASECGFESLGSFSWAFKRRWGSSPRNFAISKKST